ncbi:DinB family protein [Mucilaginibacter koreensis]
MKKDYFAVLAAYNRWADQKAMNWLSAIDHEAWQRLNPSSFSSVRQTAIHIASAEKIWVDFWTGTATPVYLSAVFSGDKDELIAIWRKAGEDLVNFISNYPENELDRPVNFVYPNGSTGQMPYYQSFAHVVNHSTYHRGQLITLLHQVGFSELSSTDLATFYLLGK